MAETPKQNTVTNTIILLILACAIAGLYIGANIVAHPDFSGKGHSYKAGYDSANSVDKKANLPKITPDAAADIAIPLKRPQLASIWLNYNLPQIQESIAVPAIFTPRMPAEIGDLTVQERKQLFVRIMLPLILAANDKIAAERTMLAKADTTQLLALAKSYRVKTDTQDSETMRPEMLRTELDKRIRPLPVSLALAQAAIESGWGTSRFTKEANALYGQWAWRAEDGVKPLEASNSRAVIRKFDTLQESVHSYMKNLNSHYAYEALRDVRAQLAQQGRTADGFDLAPYLSNYAETGAEYVETIRNVIGRNNFTNFDNLRLGTSG